MLALLVSNATASSAPVFNPVAAVNPFIGTTMTYDKQDVIDDFPGADVPFGMVQWSPDTPSQDAGGGYDYTDTAITDFSLTHLSGPGCSVFGDFGVLPTVGAVSNPASAKQPFSHVGEVAVPGYYAVTLGTPAIRAELTVTRRTGLGRFTFPATAQANLLFNASSNQSGVVGATVHTIGSHEIAGSARTGQFCGMPDLYNVYFVAQFDRPFSSHGTWKGKSVSPGSAQSQGPGSGGWVTFDATKNPVVKVKIGLSFVSEAGALANLRAENTGWSLNVVRNAAAAQWQKMLSRIEITDGTRDQQRVFYTALYHSLLHPNVISDVTGEYPGFDFKIHRVRKAHAEYGNYSGWDIYRTQAPLMALLAPQEASDAGESLVDAARQGGWLPKWALVNGYTAVMAGDPADALLAGCYAFGARDFNTRAALAAMVKGATTLPDRANPPGQGWYVERLANNEYLNHGYVFYGHTTNVAPVPNGASETLEYALADLSIAQFAKALGNGAVYRSALKRSQNWANLFNTSTGYIAARDAHGAFLDYPITPDGQPGFQEGNAAQYTWMTQEDYRDLIRGMGGRAATIKRLDTYFSQLNAQQDKPYAWMGNEPSIGDAFAYLAVGAPWKAQRVIRDVQNTQWLDEPQGMAGNDDLGTMSAWYVWNAMGLYPENPSVRLLAIGTPLFPHIVVTVPNGPTINIDAVGASAVTPYVQSVGINGRPTQKTWLDLPLRGRLNLDFAMSGTPNTSWGSAPDDAPPSYALTPVTFPPSTLATLKSAALDENLSPDASAALPFVVSNALGTTALTVNWRARPPAGIQVQPESGTVTVPVGDSSPVSPTLSAAASAATGYYDVPITARTSNGAVLADLTAIVRVNADPLSQMAYVLNTNASTITPIDVQTRGFAPVIQAAHGLHRAVLSPDRSRLYVLTADELQSIETATAHVVGSVNVGKDTSGIAISPHGRTLWISQGAQNAVLPVDAHSLQTENPIGVPSPGELAIAKNGSTLYVLSGNLGTVTPVDLRARAVGTPIAVGIDPSSLAVAPDGKKLYITRGVTDDLAIVDLATNTLDPKTIPVGVAPSSVAITPDGSFAYVANWAARTITPIDLRTNTPGAAIEVGGGPTDVLFTADGKTAFVVTNEDDAVIPVDVQSGRLGAPIRVGRSPVEIVR